jgi:antitoxin YefM
VKSTPPAEETTVNNASPFTEVRDKLREICDDVVATGNQYTITRHGKPVAVIVSADEYESLIETLNILSDPAAMEAIAEGEADPPNRE